MSRKINFIIAMFALGLLLAQPSSFVLAEKVEPVDGEKVAPPPPEFEYVQMDPLTLPVISETGVTQQISLIVSLEVKFGGTEEIKTKKPKLMDAYIQDLYGLTGSGQALSNGGILNVQMVKDRLGKVTGTVLGEDKFHDVLLQVVHQRSY